MKGSEQAMHQSLSSFLRAATDAHFEGPIPAAERERIRIVEHAERAFDQAAVDWELWIRAEGEPLPCQLRIVYEHEPGPPSSEIRFRDWNLAPEIAPEQFAAKVPDGYQRIGIVERLGDAEGEAAAGAPPAGEVKP